MVLAIDIGNTNIKIGVFDNGNLKSSFRLSCSVGRTSDEYGSDILTHLERFFDKSPKNHIDGIVISSVSPNLNYTFERLSEYYFEIKPIFVTTKLKTKLNYDGYIGELGADRIANCEGVVCSCESLPLIVIDCGTATTFNVIGEGYKFLGGAIMPGLRTSADSLWQKAAKLPRISLELPKNTIANSTSENMQFGLIYGHIGAIEYITNKINAEFAKRAFVVATGGFSEIVAKVSNVFDCIDRTLTLKGLSTIYDNNV